MGCLLLSFPWLASPLLCRAVFAWDGMPADPLIFHGQLLLRFVPCRIRLGRDACSSHFHGQLLLYCAALCSLGTGRLLLSFSGLVSPLLCRAVFAWDGMPGPLMFHG